MRQKKILIADFFGTVKERGIAAYVRDFAAVAEPFAAVKILRAPKWVKRRSTPMQNLLLVLHEQIVVPLYALRYRADLVVFPYNSCSFLLSLSRRTVCVIHDLIPYRARTRGSGLAYAYVACTARWHARLGRRFVAVSLFTARTLNALPRFRNCAVTYVPNCFRTTALPDSTTRLPRARRRVTLISGIGPNKAFSEAITLMAGTTHDQDLAGVSFDVVGFGAEHRRAEEMIAAAQRGGSALPPIVVHPLLLRSDLDMLLSANAATWAHSHAEGFGRAVVEGRVAGRPVVMSKLAVFRALRDSHTFAYDNDDPAGFNRALEQALLASDATVRYDLVERLRSDAAAGVEMLLCR